MLDIVKTALRISTDAFDTELDMLINACVSEMEQLGIDPKNPGVAYYVDDADESGYLATSLKQLYTLRASASVGKFPPIIQNAIVSYCKWQFGENSEKEKWESIYHTQIGQLKVMAAFRK